MQLKDLGAAVSFLTQIATLNKTIVKSEAERLVIEGALTKNAAAMAGSLAAAAPYVAALAVAGLAIAGIVAGIKAYRDAHPTLEMLQKDADAAKQEFDEMQSKVDETQKRIDELDKLKESGNLSSTEQAELDNLTSQNEQYERQLELLKQIAKYKQDTADKKANDDAVSALNRFLSSDDRQLARQDPDRAPGMTRVMLESHKNGLGGLLNAIDDYTAASEKLETANKALSDAKLDKADEKTLDGLRDGIADAEKDLNKQREILATFQDFLVNLRGDLTDEGSIATVDSWLDTIATTLGTRDSDKTFESFQSEIDHFTIQQKRAFEKLCSEADLTADKVTEVASKFPEFASWMSDNGWTPEDVATYINRMGNGATEAAESVATDALSAAKSVLEKAKTDMSDMSTAMSESLSSTGMSQDSINKITALYGSLEGFDSGKLFQKTTSGVHINTKELAALNDEYVRLQKLDMDSNLERLKKQYGDLGKEIDLMRKNLADEADLESYIAEYDALASKIESAEQLRAEYTALTSAYNQFIAAQSAGDRRDPFQNAANGFDSVKKLIEQGWTTDPEVENFLNLMYGKGNRSGDNVSDFNRLYENIAGTDFSIVDFFTKDSNGNITTDGLFNFLDAVKQLDSSLVQVDEDGKYAFDFSGDNLQRVSELTGLSVDAIQLLEYAMQDANFDVWFDSLLTDIDYVERKAPEAAEQLKQLGLISEDFKFDFNTTNIDSLTEQLDVAKGALEGLKDSDGKIDLSAPGAKEALLVVNKLTAKIADLNFQKIEIPASIQDTDFGKNVVALQNDIKSLNRVNAQINATVEVGGDPGELEEERDALLGSISDNPLTSELKLDTKDADSVLRSWQSQKPTIQAQVQVGASEMPSDNTQSGKIFYTADTSSISDADAKDIHGTAYYSAQLDTSGIPKTITGGYVVYKRVNQNYVPFVDGTAHANGTARGAKGVAFRGGDWGTKDSGTALGGELGAELLVRDGKWHLIGEDSAEFFQYRRGDIIFNADQTREIFEKGKITHGKKRGNALADGTAFDGGSGGQRRTTLATINASITTNSTSSSAKGAVKSNSNKEKFDWIEIAIDRIERKIKTLTKAAESAFLKIGKRLDASKDAISQTTYEISKQEAAYKRYMAEANSIRVHSNATQDARLKKAVQTGAINISLYTKEQAELINQYKEWYDKALECKEAVDDLHESLADLYKDMFDNVKSDYESQLDEISHEVAMMEKRYETHTLKGRLENADHYNDLLKQQNKNVELLNKELSSLNEQFEYAMASGEIDERSEAWYEMKSAIADVEEELADATNQAIEYENKIREIEWSYFDLIQQRIDRLTDESDFLIELMSNKELFLDDGQLSGTGMATLGLRAANYDTYMAKADEYFKEIKNIDSEIAKDPFNQTLISRRQELIDLQQDSILAAEREKDAMISLAEEGFNSQLDAMRELIDAYNESLDSAKDLYDYQKKITDKTSNIASIQKQLAAYSNDSSEENRARMQKLQKKLSEAQEELQQTEYEQYIEDQKKLLEDLYSEYEDILNGRLDSIESLFGDLIMMVNDNATGIRDSIGNGSEAVGYAVSDSLANIFNDIDAVRVYGSGNSNVNKYVSSVGAGVQESVRSYATGGLVDYTGYAHVDGTYNKPELMLNASDTKNFLALRDSLRSIPYLSALSGKSLASGYFGASPGVSSGTVIGSIEIPISIERVLDYNDMVSQLQKDKKVEKMLEALTINKLAGGSKLAENRFSFKS